MIILHALIFFMDCKTLEAYKRYYLKYEVSCLFQTREGSFCDRNKSYFPIKSFHNLYYTFIQLVYEIVFTCHLHFQFFYPNFDLDNFQDFCKLIWLPYYSLFISSILSTTFCLIHYERTPLHNNSIASINR